MAKAKDVEMNIPLLSWLALRNLLGQKKRGLSFMTICSIFGVTIGVSALIVVLSVMGGFERDLKRKMLSGEPHIELQHDNAIRGFSKAELSLQAMKKLLPSAQVAPFTKAAVVLKHRKYLATAEIIGIDPKEDNSGWAFARSILEGKLAAIAPDPARDNPGIVLGDGLRAQLGLDIGEAVTVFSPQIDASDSLLAGDTLARTYTVVGSFYTGQVEFDAKWAVVALPEGRKFMTDYDESLDDEGFVTGYGLTIPKPMAVDDLVARLKLPKGLVAKTWKDNNAAIIFALTLEKYTMGAILLLIVVVAAFSISGTIMMTVFHKQVQISLLRAIGLNRQQVTGYFMLQGLWIGVIGVVVGNLLGLGICFVLFTLKSGEIPASINSLTALPVKFLPLEYSVISVLALLLTIVGAIYPAILAARQVPSAGLRYG